MYGGYSLECSDPPEAQYLHLKPEYAIRTPQKIIAGIFYSIHIVNCRRGKKPITHLQENSKHK